MAVLVGLLIPQAVLLAADGRWSFPIYVIPLMFVMMAGMGLMMWLMMRMMMGMGGHGDAANSTGHQHHVSQGEATDPEVANLQAEVANLRAQLEAMQGGAVPQPEANDGRAGSEHQDS